MTSAARVTLPTMTSPLDRRTQTGTNRQEQVLVQHLLETLVNRLTDRNGTTHDFPWSPEQQVRIGVLRESRHRLTGEGLDGDEAGGAEARGHITRPVDNRGVIGVDFIVETESETIELVVDVTYAIYHPLARDHAAIATEARTRIAAAAASGKLNRRPTVPMQPAWTRDNRHVSISFGVPATADEYEVTSEHLNGGDPLENDAASAVRDHYLRPDALVRLSRNQTLRADEALGSLTEFRNALRDRQDSDWQPSWPLLRLTVATMRNTDGTLAVSVSITNERETSEWSVQDLAAYDTRMKVQVTSPAKLRPQMLRFAEDDLRYADVATVPGRGRGCVALMGETDNTILAETLPRHIQHQTNMSQKDVDISYGRLAADCEAPLASIATAMRAFLRTWTVSGNAQAQAQSQELRDRFEAEIERFELGLDLLSAYPDLYRAFALTNETFAAANGPTASWRLFQLVFVVSQLSSLAVREQPEDETLRAELDAVDVLWFATGGGKTEAYLGLATVGMFFDRLRGKERGTSAWLLFPLRMLSVQQLARICEVVHHAEQVRSEGALAGDPFSLGYLVGSGNTPNRLERKESHGWWPGLSAFIARSQERRDERRLVGACPKCGSADSVGLDAFQAEQRLIHVCRNCRYELPIHSSDEEVTRYQPSIVVSTVDKITAFARNGQLTSLNRGPRKGCPQHGWYTHEACVVPSCTQDPATHIEPVGFLDPTPALWIQDELHLVREELGVFAGHYHTLFAELARGAGNLPSKVITATATIEQYEDQLSQVYGRMPRLFPVGGPSIEKSFYTEVTGDIRRLYLGILPAGGGTVKVDLASIVGTHISKQIHDLLDDPTPVIAAWSQAGIAVTSEQAAEFLFDYEPILTYVNSKAHGISVLEDFQNLSAELNDAGSDLLKSEYLTGETTLGDLAAVVAAIQGDTMETPRHSRIRALVATSVISHGVDLDRLNFEVLAGMPPSYAQYIQATARAGRAHVGLVVSIFDRNNRRETSMYQSFATTHAALERMVEPVPVNRFATRAVERTLPGIVCSLLWDETRNSRWPSIESISMCRKYRRWWDANAANMNEHLRERIARAYSCPVDGAVFGPDEDRLVTSALDRWDNVERQRMQQWQAAWLTELFTSPAMTSLRDVDPPVEFSGGNRARQIIDRFDSER